jgi:hypothetical protein
LLRHSTPLLRRGVRSQIDAKNHLTGLAPRALKPGMHRDTAGAAFGIRVQKQRRTFLVMMGRERKRVALGHWCHTRHADARTSACCIPCADEQPTSSSMSVESAVGSKLFLSPGRSRPEQYSANGMCRSA